MLFWSRFSDAEKEFINIVKEQCHATTTNRIRIDVFIQNINNNLTEQQHDLLGFFTIFNKEILMSFIQRSDNIKALVALEVTTDGQEVIAFDAERFNEMIFFHNKMVEQVVKADPLEYQAEIEKNRYLQFLLTLLQNQVLLLRAQLQNLSQAPLLNSHQVSDNLINWHDYDNIRILFLKIVHHLLKKENVGKATSNKVSFFIFKHPAIKRAFHERYPKLQANENLENELSLQNAFISAYFFYNDALKRIEKGLEFFNRVQDGKSNCLQIKPDREQELVTYINSNQAINQFFSNAVNLNSGSNDANPNNSADGGTSMSMTLS